MTPFQRPTLAILAACALAACPNPELPGPPAAPTGLAATPYDGAVGLAWTASGDGATYNVYRSASSGLRPSAMTLVASGVERTAYTAAADNDLLQYYRVTATSPRGESAGSNEVAATPLSALPPAAPTNVTAVGGLQRVTLTWDAIPAATGYRVYWSLSPEVTQGGDSFSCDSSPCEHTPLTECTRYSYAVAALSATSESALSAAVSAEALALPLIAATATANTGPGAASEYSVEVYGCSRPVMGATVTVGGTPLPFDGYVYKAEAAGSLGADLELVVTIPWSWGVPPGTYRASGTMHSTAPSITNPVEGGVWQASQENALTWTPASPTAGAVYNYMAFNVADFARALGGTLPSNATSVAIPAGSLVPGTCLAWVNVSLETPIAIPDTAAGSGFQLRAISPTVNFTAQ